MIKQSRFLSAVLFIGVSALVSMTSGCLMAGNYHSAKTLEKGTGQMGLTFSSTRYQKTDNDGTTDYAAIPNVIPEITYHVGVSENVEVGGRAALGSLGGDLDVKYRFLRNDKLHLAVAPALSYQSAVLVEAIGFRLPVIATYELADSVDFNAAAFLTQTNFRSASSEFKSFDGNLTSTGAAIGLDIHGETLHIRPAVEFTQYVADLNGEQFDPFNTVNILVHVAWTTGREKKQLDRIERKIDALGAPAPGPYAPAPGPYAPAPGPYAPAPGPYAPPPGPGPYAPPPAPIEPAPMPAPQ
jgi:hypothetical protein